MPRARQAVGATFHSCRRPAGWRGLAARSGYGPHGSEARRLPGCPEGNWDLGRTFWFQLGGWGAHVVQRGEAEGGEQEEASRGFLGAPPPRPRDQVSGPQPEGCCPTPGAASDAPGPGLGWEHAGTHAHTSPQPQSLRAAVVLDRKALFLLMK